MSLGVPVVTAQAVPFTCARSRGGGLMELDRVAGRILQERLASGPDDDRVGDDDAPTAQLGDARVDVGDLESEVLPHVRWRRRAYQMHLLAPGVEPCAADAEIRAILAGRQPEYVDVETQRLVDIVDVDRHVMDCDGLHDVSVALAAGRHNWSGEREN
jgi:hypothetical protein